MFKRKFDIVLLLVLFGTVMSCFAQNFEFTNLSSTKPFYAKEPYVYEGSESYMITFNTEPEVIRALVPEPLNPLSSKVTFVFAKHKLVQPFKLNYNEAYFVIPVSFDTTFGGYIPYYTSIKSKQLFPTER